MVATTGVCSDRPAVTSMRPLSARPILMARRVMRSSVAAWRVAHAGRSTIMNPEPFSMTESTAHLGRIAILWRGDEAARRNATPETSRFRGVFAALADVGVDAKPVVYEDNVLDAVRVQLATFDGVLVWVNPIHEGRKPRQSRCALARGRGARRLG